MDRMEDDRAVEKTLAWMFRKTFCLRDTLLDPGSCIAKPIGAW